MKNIVLKIKDYQDGNLLSLVYDKNDYFDRSHYATSFFISLIVFALIAFKFNIKSLPGFTITFLISLAACYFLLWLCAPSAVIIGLSANSRTKRLSLILRNEKQKLEQRQIPLDSVESFSMLYDASQSDEKDSSLVPMKIVFLFANTNLRSVNATCWVEGIDESEEMVDLGKRLARIFNMPFDNLDRNDPKSCEVRFMKKESNISHPIPMTYDTKKNLAQAYRQDEVKKDDVLKSLVCEDWKPGEHRFSGIIQDFIPGHKLVVRYDHSCREDGFVAFLFVFSAVVIASMLSRDLAGDNFWYFLIGYSIVGLILEVAVLSILSTRGRYTPVIWDFDFDKKTLKKTKGYITVCYKLATVKEIVLQMIESIHIRQNRRDTSRQRTYKGEVVLIGIPEKPEMVVGDTGELRENEPKAYRDGLAFANMLAKNIGVSLKYKNTEEAIRYTDQSYYEVN